MQPQWCWKALLFQLDEHDKSQMEGVKEGVSENIAEEQEQEKRLMDRLGTLIKYIYMLCSLPKLTG